MVLDTTRMSVQQQFRHLPLLYLHQPPNPSKHNQLLQCQKLQSSSQPQMLGNSQVLQPLKLVNTLLLLLAGQPVLAGSRKPTPCLKHLILHRLNHSCRMKERR